MIIDPLEIIEKYYSKGSDIYTTLITHSCQVRDKALRIAKQNPNLKLDEQFISEAAMLHDIGIFKCNAHRIHCLGVHQYIEHGYLGSELLQLEGLSAHALVCERHTGVGLSLKTIVEKNLPLPHRDMLPLSLEEKLICYADKFFSKTKLEKSHTVQQIRISLLQFGALEVKTFDSWHSLFAEK